ncbi:MAG: esterase [Actinomycetota bacterium]
MENNTIGAIVGGPSASGSAVTFTVPDPDHEFAAVRLHQEIRRPRNGPDFGYDEGAGAWILDFPLPGADRMEYLVEIVHGGGTSEAGPDPHQDLRAPGAFGDKSVVVMPGYETPAWVGETAVAEGSLRAIELRCRAVRGRVPCLVWSPPGAEDDQPLPLLVVNDGPEFGNYSSLRHFFEVLMPQGRLPRFRAALLAPVDRDEIYSASATYARSLVGEMMPELLRIAPTPPGRNSRIGMGASLGALSMLYTHRRSPATFGALYLQSGSFFRTRFDKQESGFPRFRRISRFVGEVLTAEDWALPIPVVMTCGLVEENLANNRAVRAALGRQGYDVSLVENRDGHNWIGWRDTFDPHLVALIERMWT